jgi:polycystin 1L2
VLPDAVVVLRFTASSSSGKTNHADAEVRVVATPLVARIAGGDVRTVRAGDDLRLDSMSFDPDDRAAEVQHLWSCTVSGASLPSAESCDALSWHAAVNWTSPSLQIPGAALSEPDLQFEFLLAVSTDDGRNATAASTIHTSATVDLQLTVLDSTEKDTSAFDLWGVSTPSADLALAFATSTLTSSTDEDWSVVWTVMNEEGDDVTPFVTVRTNPAAASRIFILNTDSLDPNHYYTYTATLQSATTAESATASITVYHNAPPTSGTLFVTPSAGVAWDTLFEMESYGWMDEDLPLSYSFAYLLAKDMETAVELAANGQRFFGRSKDTVAAQYDIVTISSFDQRAFAQTALPANASSSVVVVYAIVCDTLGAVTVVGDVVKTAASDVDATDEVLATLQGQFDAEK